MKVPYRTGLYICIVNIILFVLETYTWTFILLQKLQRILLFLLMLFFWSWMFWYSCSFEKDQILTHLDPTVSYEHFSKCDIVVEAVFEDLKIKHKVVKEVEQVGTLFLYKWQEYFIADLFNQFRVYTVHVVTRELFMIYFNIFIHLSLLCRYFCRSRLLMCYWLGYFLNALHTYKFCVVFSENSRTLYICIQYICLTHFTNCWSQHQTW